MAEYIERGQVLALGYWHGERPDFDHPFPDGVDAVDTSDIESVPTADVTTGIKCKDCKFLDSTARLFGDKRYCHKHKGEVTEDDFCSFAERGGQNMHFPSTQNSKKSTH